MAKVTPHETGRDTASHFFIEFLPKGAYQFGFAEIQCLYAPKFNSHSASIPLEVK
jgi:hypothetical protein